MKTGDIIFVKGIVVGVDEGDYGNSYTVYIEDDEENYGRFVFDEKEGGIIYGRAQHAEGQQQ